MLRIQYDQEGDVLEIAFSESPIVESEYVEDAGLIMDYDRDGKLVGVEIVGFSKRAKKELIHEVSSL